MVWRVYTILGGKSEYGGWRVGLLEDRLRFDDGLCYVLVCLTVECMVVPLL